MTDEAKAKWEKWVLRAGALAGALAAIGLVLAFTGGKVRDVAKGWVIATAQAQTIETMKGDREAQALVNRQTAAALQDLREEFYEGRKDDRAMYALMRRFTGLRDDRLEKELPRPVAQDGGP